MPTDRTAPLKQRTLAKSADGTRVRPSLYLTNHDCMCSYSAIKLHVRLSSMVSRNGILIGRQKKEFELNYPYKHFQVSNVPVA